MLTMEISHPSHPQSLVRCLFSIPTTHSKKDCVSYVAAFSFIDQMMVHIAEQMCKAGQAFAYCHAVAHLRINGSDKLS